MKKKLRQGMTLVELAIVLVVLGIIITIVYTSIDIGIKDDAVRLQIKTHATLVPSYLSRYEMSNRPLREGDSLLILAEKNEENPSWRPMKKNAILDSWKRPYFIKIDEQGNRQICTLGGDGEPGGEEGNRQNADFCLTDEEQWPTWLKGGKKEK